MNKNDDHLDRQLDRVIDDIRDESVDPSAVEVGGRVEPTFRRLFTSDEIHNYFWKVRPVRGEH